MIGEGRRQHWLRGLTPSTPGGAEFHHSRARQLIDLRARGFDLFVFFNHCHFESLFSPNAVVSMKA
jgi:hypothetical protein